MNDSFSPEDDIPLPSEPVISEEETSRQLAQDFRKSRRKKLSLADPMKLDRLPPHSIENEQGILGCIMWSPTDCLGECAAVGVNPEWFYDLRHQAIFTAMLELLAQMKPIELISIQQWLKDRNQLDPVGGIAYISSLPETVPSAASLSYYTEIVHEKYILRKMIQTCTDAVSRAYEAEGDVDELLNEVERNVLAIRQVKRQDAMPTVKELVGQATDSIQKLFDSKGAISGLSTGLIDLDKKTNGLHPGDVTIIAAFPSCGKTSLLMNILESVVLNQSQPAGIFTMEMTSVSLVTRSLCSCAKVNLKKVADGFLSERDFPKLISAASKLANAKIYFDDSGDLSVQELRARARRMVQQYGIKLLGVDYLQLLKSKGTKKIENAQQEIADISNELKRMAKELNIPVVVLSQLTETAKGVRLRGSGDIGQDADGIWMLEKPEEKGDENPMAYPVDLWIRKQRNGERNVKIPLTFLAEFTRFESRSPIDHNDVPTNNYESKTPYKD